MLSNNGNLHMPDIKIPEGWCDGLLTPEERLKIIDRFYEQLYEAFPVSSEAANGEE